MAGITKKITPFIAATVITGLCALTLFTTLEDKIRDKFLNIMPPLHMRSDIVIATVDDSSIANIGSYPWSRDAMAKTILKIKQAGAQSVALDIAFLDNGTSQTADKELADSIKITQATYLGLIMSPEDYFNQSSDSEIQKFFTENSSLKNIEFDGSHKIKSNPFMASSIKPFLFNTKGTGFVNVSVDSDGFLRRVNLIEENNGNYYPQFALAPVLDKLGKPSIKVTKNKIILQNAKIDESTTKDINIPLTENSKLLLKFPQKKFEDYPLVPVWNFYRLALLEEQLVKNFEELDENGFFEFTDENKLPLTSYSRAQNLKNFISENPDTTFDDYKESMQKFYDNAKEFLSDSHRAELLQAAAGDEELTDYINQAFDACLEPYNDLVTSLNSLKEKMQGTICFIGLCATSTSDNSNTVSQKNYPNVGIHAVIANMILNQDYILQLPVLLSILLTLFIVLICTLLSKIMGLKGIFTSTIIFMFFYACMAVSLSSVGMYINLAFPLLSIFLNFVYSTISNYIETSKEKQFLRNTFNRYLSPSVIDQIIKDPSKLNLGGEQREMTALFTDIKSFSTLSETLTPENLVELLNIYLTKMSDCILDQKGTIDKFEGDAIIAFFGAPIHYENHAELACRSAISIKKAETLLNRDLLQAGKLKSPLFTRIGINTGDMVVGNMGTATRMDYTIMGNAVNLAARLEGVNKQYNTGGILISQYTKEQISDEFITRRLDKVRVVGIKTPVALYELLGTKAGLDENIIQMTAKWTQAMELFDARDYSKAREVFEKIIAENPDDGVARLYSLRCGKFLENPPEKDWDGVFNLNQK